MPEKDEDVTRPITLYVEKVSTDPNISYIERRRVSVIDIELTCEATEEMIEYLNKHKCENKIVGAIRVRLMGRLILS